MIRFGLGVAFAAWAFSATAQRVPPTERTGTVIGHVMCADTQRPARLAEVKLVPVPGKDAIKSTTQKPGFMFGAAPSGDAIETGLDGSYTIRNVKRGEYYLVIDKEGYLLPLSQFSLKDLADPDDEMKARIAGAVHTITVAADQTTQEDVVLERGSSVSGTVLYDDGSPASGLDVQLLAQLHNPAHHQPDTLFSSALLRRRAAQVRGEALHTRHR